MIVALSSSIIGVAIGGAIGGWTWWEPSATVVLSSLLVSMARLSWVHDGPVHDGGDDGHLRPMSPDYLAAIREDEV